MNMKNLLLKNILLIFVFIDGFGQNNSTILNVRQSGEWNIISEVPSGMTAIYFIDSTNGWVIGGGGKIYATEDGGTTWLPQDSGTENTLESIYFINHETGFVSGFNKTLICTNNKGKTWTPIQVVSDTGSIYSSLCSDADTNLYFITNYGEVFWSNDLGKNWFNKYNFDEWGFSYLNYSNNPICFAVLHKFGILYKSTDGGNVWEKLFMPSRWYGDIYFLNDDIGWITEDWALSSARHDSISIYITTNGGETWIWQSTLPEFSLKNIVFLDMREGWASTVSKIYYTSDSGQSWNCQFEFDSIEFDSIDYITDIFFLDDINGWTLTSQGKIIKYTIPTGVSVDKFNIINYDDYILNQNYPNPFNPSTIITFSIPEEGLVSLKVFNSLGEEVAELVNETKPAGNYGVNFNASGLASGVYYYQVTAGDFHDVQKMILLR